MKGKHLYLKCDFSNKPIHENHMYTIVFGKDSNLNTNGFFYCDYIHDL